MSRKKSKAIRNMMMVSAAVLAIAPLNVQAATVQLHPHTTPQYAQNLNPREPRTMNPEERFSLQRQTPTTITPTLSEPITIQEALDSLPSYNFSLELQNEIINALEEKIASVANPRLRTLEPTIAPIAFSTVVPIATPLDLLLTMLFHPAGGEFTFELQNDITLFPANPIPIPENFHITLTSSGSNTFTVHHAPGSHFLINGGRLDINGVDLTGSNLGGRGAVYINHGKVVLLEGTISNFNSTAVTVSSIFDDSNGEWAGFYMLGGSITNNTGTYGGAVRVNSYNEFGQSEFVMDGGEMSNNTATFGGGIYASDGHLFLESGSIINNIADYGGGIYFTQNEPYGTYFYMTNFVFLYEWLFGDDDWWKDIDWDNVDSRSNIHIANNTANYDGGGIYLSHLPYFHLDGGYIENNTAGNRGGGLFTSVLSEGGIRETVIRGNNAYNAGGIFIQGFLRLELGTIIDGNNAIQDGGGIYYYETDEDNQSGLIIEDGVKIINNTAGRNGGGIGFNQTAINLMPQMKYHTWYNWFTGEYENIYYHPVWFYIYSSPDIGDEYITIFQNNSAGSFFDGPISSEIYDWYRESIMVDDYTWSNGSQLGLNNYDIAPLSTMHTLTITSPSDAITTITIPASNGDIVITIQPGDTQTIELPSNVQSSIAVTAQ